MRWQPCTWNGRVHVELARLLEDLLHCTRNGMKRSPCITKQAAMAVPTLLPGLFAHQPADEPFVKSPRSEKMARRSPFLWCFVFHTIRARHNEPYTLGNGSRRTHWKSLSITTTSTRQECVRQSHSLVAFHLSCLDVLLSPSSHLISAKSEKNLRA